MKSKLTIPKAVKVGFQNRADTYSGKLAFVVFVDDKGKLRSQNAWEGWRDKQIAPVDYNNEPTSGFVLNRDVGGTHRSYSWNARREKVRVYDPRGFEFEINVENLLFILQECSSIKGKGLEGDFVYAWSGSQLILMPVSSQEYKQSVNFCELQKTKVTAKEIEPGCTYITKDDEEIMYLGRHVWREKKYINIGYNYGEVTKSDKKHIFLYLNKKNRKGKQIYWAASGFTGLSARTSDKPIPEYAEEYDNLIKSGLTSKPVKLVLGDNSFSEKAFTTYNTYGVCVLHKGEFFIGRVGYWNSSNDGRVYDIDCRTLVTIKDGEIIEKNTNGGYSKSKLTKEEVLRIVRKLYVECENGGRYLLTSEE